MKERGSTKVAIVGAVSVVILAVVVGLVVWQWHRGHHHTTSTGRSHTSKSAMAVVEITPSGFLPSTLAVQPNTNVVWVNEDVMPHLPAADPYPTHTSFPDLVAPKALGQKETYSFLFTKAETVRYHDDLNPTMTGTVEVR